MKITQSPLCSFCRETDETIEHIFWECDHVQSLLQSIDKYCMNIYWKEKETHIHFE